jgi:Fic family protein
MSVLLSGLGDMRAAFVAGRELDNPRLSRSLLSGLLLLASFPADGRSLGVAQAARMSGMSPSTTHRYLATLLAVGLLEQDSSTRRYRLADAR